MSTEQKYVEVDDSVSFTDLENNFSRVVQELVNDKSLEKFRIEYEKLHEALVTSHDQNEILVNKCKQLNDDILKHSKQIGAIVTMSQADQRTIGNLRSEFEKAWKIIEASNDKEQKSRLIIGALKSELENLSKLISKGGAIQEEQTTAKQTLEEETSLLKQEIDGNEKLLTDLRQQLETAQLETSQMEGVINVIKPEIDDGTVELEQHINTIHDLTEEAVKLQQDMKNTEREMDKMEEEKENVKNQKEECKLRMKKKQRQLSLHKDSIESLEDDLRKQQLAVQKRKNELVKTKRATAVTEGRHKNLAQVVEEKMKENTGYPQMLANLTRENEDFKYDFEEIQRYKSEVHAAKMEYRKALIENRKVTLDITTASNWEELEARKFRLQADTADTKVRDTQNKIKILKKEKEQEIVNQKAVENNITSQKSDIHKNKNFASNMQDDIKDALDQVSEAVSNRNEVLEIIDNLNLEIDNLNIELGQLGGEIKYVESIKDVMRTDRDTKNRLLQTELTLIKKIESDCDAVKKENDQMKEDIRRMDESTAKEHLQKLDLMKELEALEKEMAETEAMTKEVIRKTEELREEINNQTHVLNEADIDKSSIDKMNESVRQHMATIRNKISQKLVEKQDIQSQIATLHNQMYAYHKTFERIIDTIEQRKSDLYRLVEKRDQLMYKCRICDALRNEKKRCEKELIDAQSRVTALEEEMENPISVNKWILLEATNPEVAQMLHMKFAILNEMADKMALTTKLRVRKESAQSELAKVEKDLQRRKGTNVSAQFKYYQEVLNRKTRQLNKLEGQYNERNGVVVETKADIKTVRGELRTEKTEMLDIKSQIAAVRASTANNRDRFRRGINRPKGETVFVGGGFAYQGSPQMQLVIPPLQTNASIRVQSQRGRSVSPPYYAEQSFLPRLHLQSPTVNRRLSFNDDNETENPVRPPAFTPSGPRTARRSKRQPLIEVN